MDGMGIISTHILCIYIDRKSSFTDVGQKEFWSNRWCMTPHENPFAVDFGHRMLSRWGFHFLKNFTTIWGRFPIWLIFFRWVGTTNQLFRTFRLFQANRLVKYMIKFTQRYVGIFHWPCWSSQVRAISPFFFWWQNNYCSRPQWSNLWPVVGSFGKNNANISSTFSH